MPEEDGKSGTRFAELVRIDLARPERAFLRCGESVRSGGLIVYPTDTFYGLGADPGNSAAVKRLFDVKRRPMDRPILLLIADAREALNWAAETTVQAERLIQKFWPGPLTLVFKARPGVLPELTAGTGTIGLRVPGNELTRRLLAFLGGALTGTSANVSGGPDPRTAEQAMKAIGSLVDCVLDGGGAAGGRPSTIVDVTTGAPKVLREGEVPSAEILKSLRKG